jgi:WD40 repeat protein
MYHRGAIENSGLQAYASALMFSPRNSLTRRHFQHEEPGWMTIVPTISDSWSACLQTLEGHSSGVFSVTFSHDSTWLASASGTSTILELGDNTVKVWDLSSGRCLQTLQGHSRRVCSVVFSHDSTRLASASGDKTVKVWDASSGRCLQTLQGHSNTVYSVAFSHDSTRLASASYDKTVKVWDASSWRCLQTLETGHRTLSILSFDPAGMCLHTDYGSIALRSPITSSITDNADPLPQDLCIGVSSDRTWITFNGKNVLWVPSEYRALCSTVIGTSVGIGVGSGRVWICSFDCDRAE